MKHFLERLLWTYTPTNNNLLDDIHRGGEQGDVLIGYVPAQPAKYESGHSQPDETSSYY